MNSHIRFNFVTLMIAAVVFLLFGSFVFLSLSDTREALSQLYSEITDTQMQNKEIDDVEGYGMLVNSVAFIAGSFVSEIAMVFGVYIPILHGIVIGMLAVVAKVVHTPRKARPVLYRIIMMIAYLFAGILPFIYGFIFISSSGAFSPGTAIAVLLMLYFAFMLITGIRNTFSSRIQFE